ncbi:MAG: hypothetical protein U9R16_06970 [Campylobacterota bacterium]|nr:hypothetical protein [Campylobacterota bacterium]
MFKLFLSISVLVSFANSSEMSMFGAGDLDSPTPYGLTSAEKVIVKNKKTVAKNEKKIKKVDVVIQDLEERLDGLESLIEGDSQKLNKVYLNLNKQIEKTNSDTLLSKSTQDNNKRSLEELTLDISELKLIVDGNNENIKSIKKSFDKIVLLVNDINKNYITRSEFNKLIKMLDKEEIKAKKKSSTKVTRDKTPQELMREVRVLFKKDYFTKALPILEHLVDMKHRPAECNYYIGEIKYYRKKYKDALYYFKTSMMLYDKANYLPKLLLHSAISFEKTGDQANADNFYSTLIEIYPDTNEAKEASKKIK